MRAKILIVEDSPPILMLLEAILTSAGFMTESCRNGLEAMQLLKAEKPFDLVLTDESMPQLKGSELAYFMRGTVKYKHTPIILASAEEDDRFFGKLVAEQVINLYYPKPFKAAGLVNMVNLLLRQSNKVRV